MADFENAEFRIAWARVVSQASVDDDLRARVETDPVPVFEGLGATGHTKRDLQRFVKEHLEADLGALARADELRQGAAEAVSASQSSNDQSGDAAMADSSSANMSVCYCATQQCMCQGSAQTIPCWGQNVTSASGSFGSAGASSTRLAGSMATSRAGGMAFDSFGTLGSLGTWCGTGACAGTLGSLLEDAPRMQAAGGNLNSAGTLGSFATFYGAIGGQGQSSTCWGTMFGY